MNWSAFDRRVERSGILMAKSGFIIGMGALTLRSVELDMELANSITQPNIVIGLVGLSVAANGALMAIMARSHRWIAESSEQNTAELLVPTTEDLE